ncbi:hypothetical protein ACM5OO_004707, partial [Escherichia coli]
MQSQTNIHNVFLFTTINNSITIIEMNDGLYKEYTLPPHSDNMIQGKITKARSLQGLTPGS